MRFLCLAGYEGAVIGQQAFRVRLVSLLKDWLTCVLSALCARLLEPRLQYTQADYVYISCGCSCMGVSHSTVPCSDCTHWRNDLDGG